MILESVLGFLFNILVGLLEILPDISWSVDSSAFTSFLSFISVVLYLLPIDTLLVMFSIVMYIMSFKIGVALIKTIWDILPLT